MRQAGPGTDTCPTETAHTWWSPALQEAAWPDLGVSQVSSLGPASSPVLTHLAPGGLTGKGLEHGADGIGGWGQTEGTQSGQLALLSRAESVGGLWAPRSFPSGLEPVGRERHTCCKSRLLHTSLNFYQDKLVQVFNRKVQKMYKEMKAPLGSHPGRGGRGVRPGWRFWAQAASSPQGGISPFPFLSSGGVALERWQLFSPAGVGQGARQARLQEADHGSHSWVLGSPRGWHPTP